MSWDLESRGKALAAEGHDLIARARLVLQSFPASAPEELRARVKELTEKLDSACHGWGWALLNPEMDASINEMSSATEALSCALLLVEKAQKECVTGEPAADSGGAPAAESDPGT